jgi:hypothetical protein
MAQVVPIAPGVPAVLNIYATLAETASLVTADAEIISQILSGPQWGIFSTDGTPILFGTYTGAAVVDVGYHKEFTVATFPVEEGTFASYDKVENPYEAKVTLSIGGSLEARVAAIATIKGLISSTTLVDVVTPEDVFANANLVHVDYDRAAAKGAGMLNLDLWLEEIRVSASAPGSNAAQPNGTNSVSGGTVQATSPTAGQQTAITSTGVQ